MKKGLGILVSLLGLIVLIGLVGKIGEALNGSGSFNTFGMAEISLSGVVFAVLSDITEGFAYAVSWLH